MAISISIPTTPRQDTKLAKYLDWVNDNRIKSGLTPYDTIDDLLEDFLIENTKNLVQQPDIEDAEKVKAAYIDANDNIQSQVKSLLGIT